MTVLKLTILMIVINCALFLGVNSASAQQACQLAPATSPKPRAEGLITSPSVVGGSIFYNDINTCVINTPQAAFVPFKVPTYSDLRNKFYEKVKDTSSTPVKVPTSIQLPLGSSHNLQEVTISASETRDVVVHITKDFTNSGNLLVDGPITITNAGSVLVFVDGDMSIKSNVTYGNKDRGIVFVVKGNINIGLAVTRIDAALISEGTVCTAYDFTGGNFTGACILPRTNPIITQPLVINGNLISINPNTGAGGPTANIKFSRWAVDPSGGTNIPPAETVKQQGKYLSVLNNLFTQTLSITTEDTSYSINLDAIPSPFQYSINPHSDLIVPAGGSVDTTFTSQAVGGAVPQPVNFTATVRRKDNNLPATGITLTPITYACTPNCDVPLNIAIDSTAPQIDYVVKLQGDGIPSHAREFTLTVRPPVSLTAAPGPGYTSFLPGKNATLTWSNPTINLATVGDQIKLYNTNSPAVLYASNYTSNNPVGGPVCNNTQPTSPLASGSCFFAMPSSIPPGTYRFKLVSIGGNLVLGSSSIITVQPTPAISVSPATAQRTNGIMSPLVVTWTNVQNATVNNSIKFYSAGGPGYDSWLFKVYLNPGDGTTCQTTPPATVLKDAQGYVSGSCTIQSPIATNIYNNLPAGPYEIRMVTNDTTYASTDSLGPLLFNIIP